MTTDKPNDNVFGDVIYAYTRRQAIEDGVLVDVTETVREAGFKWPFAMTSEVWALIEDIPEKYGYEDVTGRLWDVLNVVAAAAVVNLTGHEGQIIRFTIGPSLFYVIAVGVVATVIG